MATFGSGPRDVFEARSTERHNFYTLCTLLIDGGTRVLRDVLDHFLPPAELERELSDQRVRNTLPRSARLTKKQCKILYPTPATCGKSNDFDITMLFQILRFAVFQDQKLDNGWNELPPDEDHRPVADLVRIKFYRNKLYAQVTETKVCDEDFDRYWNGVSEALERLKKMINSTNGEEWEIIIFDCLESSSVTDCKRDVRELHRWCANDMESEVMPEPSVMYANRNEVEMFLSTEHPVNQRTESEEMQRFPSVSAHVGETTHRATGHELVKDSMDSIATVDRSISTVSNLSIESETTVNRSISAMEDDGPNVPPDPPENYPVEEATARFTLNYLDTTPPRNRQEREEFETYLLRISNIINAESRRDYTRRRCPPTRGPSSAMDNSAMSTRHVGQYLTFQSAMAMSCDALKEAAPAGQIRRGIEPPFLQLSRPVRRTRDESHTVFIPRRKSDGVNTEGSPGLTKSNVESIAVVTSDGGMLRVQDTQLFCPPGAVDKSSDPVTIRLTLEEPAKRYGLIVQKGLENDVIFAAPIIKLQPHGQVLKKPVTVTTKMRSIQETPHGDLVVMHGTQGSKGKIVWEDITPDSKADIKSKEIQVCIDRFCFIAFLYTLTCYPAKYIATRLNLWPINYTLDVLFKDSHPHLQHAELALVFTRQDIYHDKSQLMQLKDNGFEQLCSMDAKERGNIYFNETLQVQIRLGKDYQAADGLREIIDFALNSSVWWSTGHVIKLKLRGTGDVRILCGKVTVQGQYKHYQECHFCELDLCGYVKRQLRVMGATANFIPLARKLGVRDQAMNEVISCWNSDDEQLNLILKLWQDKDPDVLRKDLQELKPEDYCVKERGQMQIKQLRELAVRCQELNHENPDMLKHFSGKSANLCRSVLKDCCIELEKSKEGVETAASTESPADFLEIQDRISQDFVQKYQHMSSESPAKTSIENFLLALPELIQAIKEIFSEKLVPEIQSGLRGLQGEFLDQCKSNIQEAAKSEDILTILNELCQVLKELCLANPGNRPTSEIERLGTSLGQITLLDDLKRFFQSSEETRLWKRLELCFGSTRKVDEATIPNFCNLSLSLLLFAKFAPSKLVRFELMRTRPSDLHVNSEAMKYNEHENTFSQQFQLRKETDCDQEIDAIAHVHIDGQLKQVGVFKSQILLLAFQEEAFERASFADLPVVVKKEAKASGSVQITLYSSQKENVAKALISLENEIGEDAADWKQTKVVQCPLSVRTYAETGTIVRLRFVYKWQSEAIILESNDFMALCDPLPGASSADRQTGASESLETRLAALSTATNSNSSDASSSMDPSFTETIQRHVREECGNKVINLYQTIQNGHICVSGERTTMKMEAPNIWERSPQEALSAAPLRSITAGTSSSE